MKFTTLFVSILIIVAVLIPGSDLPDVDIGSFDKLIHMAMFATWAVAVRYDFHPKSIKFPSIFGAGLLFSVVTEVLQILVEGRSFDIYDMIADAIGLLIGIGISGPLVRWVKQGK